MSSRVIEVVDLVAGYQPEIDILHGISAHVDEGEIVTIVGANGAGKSTLLKSIMGWVTVRSGSITINGHDTLSIAPYEMSAAGIGYTPQLANVFPSLSIDENLRLGVPSRKKDEYLAGKARVEALFPALREARNKPAGLLSGGQRQMLAMGRALMAQPRVLLLDEPTAGLSPQNVDLLFHQVQQIRDSGVTILMVEQNARRALDISDRGYVFDLGRNRATGTGAELLSDPDIVAAYLGSAGGGRPQEANTTHRNDDSSRSTGEGEEK
ncbi:ABC transporter ATP-binding protein [Microbacterium soli]|uniref:ABC transporter ATP-binding protein n=1 Tax=Microbacterium soli TaxID=446075 RepID=A0ABP7NEG1_9MICO